MTRAVMWFLLATVATAAAVLSFAALRDLALLCGFDRSLSWLMPVVVDAGAAAGCLIWLGTSSPVRALRFARALTWVLLASSVAGNAVTHYLDAYGLRPAWWLVVAVSAIAPAVLGAVVHLSVLVGRDVSMSGSKSQSEILVRNSGPNFQSETPVPSPAPRAPEPATLPASTDTLLSRTRELYPIGRRVLARELDVGEGVARNLLDRVKAEQASNNGHRVLTEA